MMETLSLLSASQHQFGAQTGKPKRLIFNPDSAFAFSLSSPTFAPN
jgi:hypothetical protein